MALLLAMYQKMRLIREKNQLVLEQTQLSSKVSRVEKNIERQQKYWTALIAKVDQRAKEFTSMGNIWFQNQAGLGQGSVNPLNYTGMNGYVMNAMCGMLSNGIPKYETQNGTTTQTGTIKIDQSRFQAMLNVYNQHGSIPYVKKSDGTVDWQDETKQIPKYVGGFTHDEVQAFNTAKNMAQNQLSQTQMWVQTASQNYAQNISIWAEAEKAKYEAQQDAVIEPLTYEQTMLELEKNQKDARLKRIETELQNYSELASKEAESMAPTFGLR